MTHRIVVANYQRHVEADAPAWRIYTGLAFVMGTSAVFFVLKIALLIIFVDLPL